MRHHRPDVAPEPLRVELVVCATTLSYPVVMNSGRLLGSWWEGDDMTSTTASKRRKAVVRDLDAKADVRGGADTCAVPTSSSGSGSTTTSGSSSGLVSNTNMGKTSFTTNSTQVTIGGNTTTTTTSSSTSNSSS